MLFVSTAEDSANPLGQLVSTEQPLGLNYLAFAMNPLGLYCVEPRALGGQQTRHYPDPMAAGFDIAVVGGDPVSDLMAFMPGGIVPDEKQSLLTPLLEPVAAPREKLCGYGAHGSTIHEPQPSLLKLRQIQSVAGESLRLGIVLSRLFFEETRRLSGISPGMHTRSLEAGEPGLVLETQSPLGAGLGQPDQPISIPFFLSYSGSGLSIQCLARCQPLPRRAKVARMVSALTLFSVIPSSKLTCAAITKVHKVLSLANSLGEWCKSSLRASVCSLPKAVWVCLGREEPATRASTPRRLKSWIASRTVCEAHPRFSAICGAISPRALARSIWQRRRTKASLERSPSCRALRSFFESVRTKMGGFIISTIAHNLEAVLKMH
jgi:hypothetical protein